MYILYCICQIYIDRDIQTIVDSGNTFDPRIRQGSTKQPLHRERDTSYFSKGDRSHFLIGSYFRPLHREEKKGFSKVAKKGGQRTFFFSLFRQILW